MPINDVNFIPEEIIQDRRMKSSSQSTGKFGILVMVTVLLVAGGLFGYNTFKERKLKSLDESIQSTKSEIEKYKEFGQQGYLLAQRLEAIKTILNNRIYYTVLIEEVANLTPKSVILNSYKVSTESNSISFSADAISSVIPITTFQANIKDSSDQILGETSLKSATLDSSGGKFTFTLDVQIDNEKLKKLVE